MRLSALIDGTGARVVAGRGDIEIRGLSADSRRCGPGHLFAALPGAAVDGRSFVGEALRAGSVAVLTEDKSGAVPEAGDATVLASRLVRRSFALVCARFFARQPRLAVAVTGTNGKSSVAEFCRQLWALRGERAATLGTLGVVGTDGAEPLALTTPDPVTLHARLRALADSGVERVAIEASSHGLDQRRLDGVALGAAAFTALGRDHFDYHPTPAAYFEAKARLFDLVDADGTAVLNADMPGFDGLARRCRARGLDVVSFGAAGTGLRLGELTALDDGRQEIVAEAGGKRVRVAVALPGRFQAMNVLCAAALVASIEDCPPLEALAAAGALEGVRGRLEPVGGHPAGARIYVDYAHTPDALDNMLCALRPATAGRLVVVFGCGGDRDRTKRGPMGEVAARHADDVLVTDDNPRSEDPAGIRRAILAGAPRAREVASRGDAIRAAVAALGPDDVLVIAGKGHESGQIVGDRILPFDDRCAARRAVAALRDGP